MRGWQQSNGSSPKHAAQSRAVPSLDVPAGFIVGMLLGVLTVALLVLLEPWAGPTR